MATRAIRQAETGAARTMIDRTIDRFGLHPERLIADTAYGAAPMLNWLVEDRGIEPHIPVFDKSARRDGTFERSDFTYEHRSDTYTCPAGKTLKPRRRHFVKPRDVVGQDDFIKYRSGIRDCAVCPLKPRCCPHTPERKVSHSIYEGARDMARAIAATETYAESRRLRKKVEVLFAHLKRILGLRRFRLRGPCGVSDEVHLAAAAQNLRRLAKMLAGNPTPSPA